MTPRARSKTRTRIRQVEGGHTSERSDQLATEEPLEIRLAAGGRTRTLAITMRTPGADFELVAGFLHGEGVIGHRRDARELRYCTDPALDAAQQYNVVTVELASTELPDLPGLDRHFFTSSACGVCGKASLDALESSGCESLPEGFEVDAATLYRIPDRLRDAQGLFESTGGLHAAGLFTADGELICLREDVGRHNAVDKVVGWALLEGGLPLTDRILMVSGRSSYEILQKALVAGIPVVCSVSAPSSLAVDVARRFGMTLVGFLRGERFNVYTGSERIRLPSAVEATR
ncbi:MAG: formate dehydrogenase accessory sulfurtransferase FdhD [Gemmatimonadota bacterium]|nr:formate dehydrogenase accessory sulfurtransferase FdhD [Gemmatimonadota bacterium]